MKVGDLVEVCVRDAKDEGPAIIVELDEPTVRQPYQLATVQFFDGFEEKFVTTALKILSSKS